MFGGSCMLGAWHGFVLGFCDLGWGQHSVGVDGSHMVFAIERMGHVWSFGWNC